MNAFSMTASYDDGKPGHEIGHVSGNNFVKGTLFLLFILVPVLLMVRLIMNPGTFPIRTVSITGEFRHLSPQVLKEGVTDVVRGGFFDVNVETIQKTLLGNPWVNKVSVQRVWPDGLKVQVTERVAAARWKDQGLLGRDSVFFAPAAETYPPDLPVFSGPDKTYKLLLDRYNSISELLKKTNLKVVALNLNARGAFDFELSNGIKIIVGRNRIEKRIEIFAQYVWPALKDNFWKISGIDMRYTNGFVVSWKKNTENIVETGKENHG